MYFEVRQHVQERRFGIASIAFEACNHRPQGRRDRFEELFRRCRIAGNHGGDEREF